MSFWNNVQGLGAQGSQFLSGSDGGYESEAADNASNFSDTADAVSAESIAAQGENVKENAEAGKQFMEAQTAINAMNKGFTVAGSVQY